MLLLIVLLLRCRQGDSSLPLLQGLASGHASKGGLLLPATAWWTTPAGFVACPADPAQRCQGELTVVTRSQRRASSPVQGSYLCQLSLDGSMKTSRAELQQQVRRECPASRKRRERPHSIAVWRNGLLGLLQAGWNCAGGALQSLSTPETARHVMALGRLSDHSYPPERPPTDPPDPVYMQRLASCGVLKGLRRKRSKFGCNVLASPRSAVAFAVPLCCLPRYGALLPGGAHRGGCGGEACRGEQSEHDESTVPGHARDLCLGARRRLCLPGSASYAKSD